jgi:2-dehydropantoate 2-reductase
MKLDFEAKRPMEIEAIYSNAIKKAESAGCEMKKVKMLEQQLCFIQDTYLPKR